MRIAPLTLLLCLAPLGARTPQPARKPDPGAESARKAFADSLDAVDSAWFGKAYQGVTSVQLQGTLAVAVSGDAVKVKAAQLSQGAVKVHSQGGNVRLKVDSTYFANGDYRTELAGDFGNLLATRRGDRGFIYSKDQNAYTTRVDAPPSDAPLTFMAWFRQVLNEIRGVYIDAPTFKASTAGDKLVFDAPTKSWDAKKREQSLDDSLGFWKRGHLEVALNKETRQPTVMDFHNEEQGIRTRMDFLVGKDGKVQAVSIANSSRGFEGPGSIRVGYGGDGLIHSLQGELSSGGKRITFDLTLAWSKDRQPASLLTVPPAGAKKRGREELETGLMVSLAGRILDLQRSGLNLRSVTLAPK
ncbi:MAG TPA: hypothetical protein VJ600_01460 [Holophagaceae bacterium]|nr:hypothetical protein [Holophagaceae bacterium]